ncbi:MAG: sugar transferase [Anaerolineaceae bacterium]|jgi:exopolysaccharide biosynthesis polyprenyl glycosylphosphotransferase|nr:sugar transferase [Anaerolineaceae bacterium]MDD4042722.1 sugar transferase [Anaerolineaceae bacterium]MDD4577069.1 sugar transferase [Anaerolineaceae bacterium]
MKEDSTSPTKEKFRFERREQTLLLVLGDLFAAVLALGIALLIWAKGDTWLGLSLEFLRQRIPVWFYFLPLLWIILMADSYDIRKAGNLKSTLKSLGIALIASAAIYLVVYFASEPNSMPRFGIAIFLVFTGIFTFLWRLLYVRFFTSASKQKRALIIGAGRAGSALAKIVSEQDPPPFTLVGLIDDDPEKLGMTVEGFPILGGHKDLPEIIEKQQITDLILSISNEMNPGMFQAILTAQEKGMGMSTMQDTYESLTNRVPITLLEFDWVIRSFIDRKPASGFYRLFKRLTDLVFGLIGMIGLIILYPPIAICIFLDSRGPIIFRQTRLGRGGSPYTMLKFRTMKDNKDMVREALVTAENDPRVTRFGRFLRKSHLDELPQIINVLRGEMSFVGPRSERSELVTIFQKEVPFYRARMLVKPGITGWAQIHQNYAETVEETAIKLEYDLYYIENASVLMDISIIMRTLTSVLGFKGR